MCNVKKKLTNISRLGDRLYLLNHKFRVQIDEPIDIESVKRYFPIYFYIRSCNYTFRFTSKSLLLQGLGVNFKIVQIGESYELTISEHYIDGIGGFKTYSTKEVLDFKETVRRVNAY